MKQILLTALREKLPDVRPSIKVNDEKDNILILIQEGNKTSNTVLKFEFCINMNNDAVLDFKVETLMNVKKAVPKNIDTKFPKYEIEKVKSKTLRIKNRKNTFFINSIHIEDVPMLIYDLYSFVMLKMVEFQNYFTA